MKGDQMKDRLGSPFEGPNPNKFLWPELVGVLATPAVMKIMQDRPDVAVEVLPPGSTVTPGFNRKRVRVFVDENSLVQQTPIIG